ncbi:hypothetical protein EDD28_1467 [Salana multivorans]|uniref:BNR repeat protein n=1 Tax=Salana multivorans TaxID=120377 RepID=A0A3N2DAQ0_9MICO|nr:hypothetical protein [Salana multivorans]ROR96875.1 hypothetical protein EDD28_1467 [Salana multivorans]
MTIEIDTGVEDVAVRLHPAPRQTFGSFVDCNMATAWVGEEFRIFPGKYGEDPVWGDGAHLMIGRGGSVAAAFARDTAELTPPVLPPVAPRAADGLHGAVWFETVYQHPEDPTGRTLSALYHNENYPETLPFDPATGRGLRDEDWPPGLRGADSVQAVPRIGIMRSTDGGESWVDRGILLEDRDERMIRLPVNRNECFPGGVGDPSAVACGDHLYVFYGEYAYPEAWNARDWDDDVEADGQCVSVARVPLRDLDAPTGAARRWDGTAFAAPWDGAGRPIESLRIPAAEGGGGVSQGDRRFYWGPSVSWNEAIGAWVMLLGRVDAPLWVGDSLFLSINTCPDLGDGDASQRWSRPVRIVHRPGHTLWYPSLQPVDSAEDLELRRTCLRLGARSRLWFKDMTDEAHEYLSEHEVELVRTGAAR